MENPTYCLALVILDYGVVMVNEINHLLLEPNRVGPEIL